MNKLIVLIDGASDLPCKQLGNKTPLEAAYTPNLDFIAKNSKKGVIYVINKKIAPESDEAMLALLGFNPFKVHSGRGPLEAYGANIKFKKNSLVLRCNFIKIKNDFITDIEPILSKNKIKLFSKKLNKIKLPVKFKFIPTIGHRAVLILENCSDKVSNTHPGYNIVKNYVTSAVPVFRAMKIKNCIALNKEAKDTARAINKFVRESRNIIKNYAVITRGAGNKLPKLKKIKNWVLMADMPVEKAIGKLVGMRIVKKTNNYRKDARIILRLAKKHNVYVQIKGPDSFAHKNLPVAKMKSIEKIDGEFFSIIKKANAIMCVTADHSTPCKLKAHSNDPVPLLIYGKGKDGIKRFTEKACRNGSVGKIYGNELMKMIV